MHSPSRFIPLALTAMLCCVTCDSSGQSWQPSSAPNFLWVSAAVSSNGTKLVASSVNMSAGTGAIYASGDSGTSWTRVLASTNLYYGVACSADGVKLIASWSWANTYGGVYLSQNAGASWVPATGLPNQPFAPVTSSGDGTKLAAGGSGIYVSTDSGANWTLTTAPTNSWRSMASSADGRVLAAIPTDRSGIYVSTDSGASWVLDTIYHPGLAWAAVACSADGTKMVAAAESSGVWTRDSITYNWQQTSVPLSHSWESVACSADGVGLVALSGLGDDMVSMSADSGVTWSSNTPFFDVVVQWLCVASSASGNRLLAGGMTSPNQGFLYTYSPPKPLLSISRSGNGAVLSWSTYPGGFFPQQTLDLSSDIWTPVTIPANIINNQNRIPISNPVGKAFYRLSAQ